MAVISQDISFVCILFKLFLFNITPLEVCLDVFLESSLLAAFISLAINKLSAEQMRMTCPNHLSLVLRSVDSPLEDRGRSRDSILEM